MSTDPSNTGEGNNDGGEGKKQFKPDPPEERLALYFGQLNAFLDAVLLPVSEYDEDIHVDRYLELGWRYLELVDFRIIDILKLIDMPEVYEGVQLREIPYWIVIDQLYSISSLLEDKHTSKIESCLEEIAERPEKMQLGYTPNYLLQIIDQSIRIYLEESSTPSPDDKPNYQFYRQQFLRFIYYFVSPHFDILGFITNDEYSDI